MPASQPAAAAAEPVTLLDQHDVLLLDLDGVVYVGPHAVPGAVEALTAATARGTRLAYVTNNASRPPEVVAAHLRELGLPCADADVVTSAQAAVGLLAGLVPDGSRVLNVGGDGLHAALVERGYVPVRSADDAPAAVVQGFAPTMSWDLLAEGAYALAEGLPWVATNLDATFPTPRGRAPGNGTLVAALARTSGREPVVAGKPRRPLLDEAVRRTGASSPLVVGDRLDTDVEGAVAAGLPSLLVLTGVTGPEEAVLAPVEARPTHVARDLAALHEPVRPPRRDGDLWRCGRWVALVEDGVVLVVPDPEGAAGESGDDALDALRAACAAAHAAPLAPRAVRGLPPLH